MDRWTYTQTGKKSTRELLEKAVERVAEVAMEEVTKLNRNPDVSEQAKLALLIRKAMHDIVERTDARKEQAWRKAVGRRAPSKRT